MMVNLIKKQIKNLSNINNLIINNCKQAQAQEQKWLHWLKEFWINIYIFSIIYFNKLNCLLLLFWYLFLIYYINILTTKDSFLPVFELMNAEENLFSSKIVNILLKENIIPSGKISDLEKLPEIDTYLGNLNQLKNKLIETNVQLNGDIIFFNNIYNHSESKEIFKIIDSFIEQLLKQKAKILRLTEVLSTEKSYNFSAFINDILSTGKEQSKSTGSIIPTADSPGIGTTNGTVNPGSNKNSAYYSILNIFNGEVVADYALKTNYDSIKAVQETINKTLPLPNEGENENGLTISVTDLAENEDLRNQLLSPRSRTFVQDYSAKCSTVIDDLDDKVSDAMIMQGKVRGECDCPHLLKLTEQEKSDLAQPINNTYKAATVVGEYTDRIRDINQNLPRADLSDLSSKLSNANQHLDGLRVFADEVLDKEVDKLRPTYSRIVPDDVADYKDNHSDQDHK